MDATQAFFVANSVPTPDGNTASRRFIDWLAVGTEKRVELQDLVLTIRVVDRKGRRVRIRLDVLPRKAIGEARHPSRDRSDASISRVLE